MHTKARNSVSVVISSMAVIASLVGCGSDTAASSVGTTTQTPPAPGGSVPGGPTGGGGPGGGAGSIPGGPTGSGGPGGGSGCIPNVGCVNVP
ncbi:hypothetical protein [Mycobacteroides chelonae]|uniref:hypothetical protein n=1 Tax=Mycobacteroides chelonae TaxID=1774 RepID=UPI000992D4C9